VILVTGKTTTAATMMIQPIDEDDPICSQIVFLEVEKTTGMTHFEGRSEAPGLCM
jgi:hypothetical protein